MTLVRGDANAGRASPLSLRLPAQPTAFLKDSKITSALSTSSKIQQYDPKEPEQRTQANAQASPATSPALPDPNLREGSSCSISESANRINDSIVAQVKAFIDGKPLMVADSWLPVIEFSNVNSFTFSVLEDALNLTRIRYSYNTEQQSLAIQCPSAIHDKAARAFGDVFEAAMTKEAEERQSTIFNWESSNTAAFFHSNLVDTFIPDFAVFLDSETPFLVLEVSWSQSLTQVKEKLARLLKIPSLCGAIIVNIEEQPAFRNPQKKFKKISTAAWKDAEQSAPSAGPISVDGLRWVGDTTCTVYVQYKHTNVFSEVSGSLIPRGKDLSKLNSAISALWGKVVESASKTAVSTSDAEMNWESFERIYSKALRMTAYERYLKWRAIQSRLDMDGDLSGDYEAGMVRGREQVDDGEPPRTRSRTTLSGAEDADANK
ncbi:hypothetical protein BD410DRAFT_888958 [Rickenella mellea]|uniref:Uncharacterized protein n=1 Tax=Rickenella mellea TaxID=50990 RepID=A0A4Y7PN35_9AGAM|nr:hypothetical protein BD410DRAFT_888958 [Rickenella mellea]